MLTRCHNFSDRLTRWTFAFYVVANANFRVRMISAYLAYTRTTRINIKIEPSFTQCVRAMLACTKTPIVTDCPDCQKHHLVKIEINFK